METDYICFYLCSRGTLKISLAWWQYQMETFSTLLAICSGNSPGSGELPAQRPVTWSFDVFFDPRLDGRLSKHSWGWWLETPLCPLWRQSNGEKCTWVGPWKSGCLLIWFCYQLITKPDNKTATLAWPSSTWLFLFAHFAFKFLLVHGHQYKYFDWWMVLFWKIHSKKYAHNSTCIMFYFILFWYCVMLKCLSG